MVLKIYSINFCMVEGLYKFAWASFPRKILYYTTILYYAILYYAVIYYALLYYTGRWLPPTGKRAVNQTKLTLRQSYDYHTNHKSEVVAGEVQCWRSGTKSAAEWVEHSLVAPDLDPEFVLISLALTMTITNVLVRLAAKRGVTLNLRAICISHSMCVGFCFKTYLTVCRLLLQDIPHCV